MKQPRKSNGRYSHKGIDLLNWRIWVLVATILFCLIASHYGNKDNSYRKEISSLFMPPKVVETPKIECPIDGHIEETIAKHFPKNKCKMIAIAKAESRLKMSAKGFNCYYSKGVATTTPIKGGSKACKVEDRHLAHSVDCFILQDNQPGSKECPKGVTLDQHVKEMAELSRICGLNCWWAYRDGSWKKYYQGNLASN